MAETPDIKVKINYTEFAEGLDLMRELLRATVSGLMADGYTEEQAREITTAIMSRRFPDE